MKLARAVINRILLLLFSLCLIAAMVEGIALLYFPVDVAPKGKLLSSMLLLFLILTGVFFDLMACKRGAAAMFSQDVMGWTKVSRVCSDSLLILTGAVLGHLVLAHEPEIPNVSRLSHYILMAVPLAALIVWACTTLLGRRSDVG
jgi:hypothetical protein